MTQHCKNAAVISYITVATLPTCSDISAVSCSARDFALQCLTLNLGGICMPACPDYSYNYGDFCFRKVIGMALLIVEELTFQLHSNYHFEMSIVPPITPNQCRINYLIFRPQFNFFPFSCNNGPWLPIPLHRWNNQSEIHKYWENRRIGGLVPSVPEYLCRWKRKTQNSNLPGLWLLSNLRSDSQSATHSLISGITLKDRKCSVSRHGDYSGHYWSCDRLGTYIGFSA